MAGHIPVAYTVNTVNTSCSKQGTAYFGSSLADGSTLYRADKIFCLRLNSPWPTDQGPHTQRATMLSHPNAACHSVSQNKITSGNGQARPSLSPTAQLPSSALSSPRSCIFNTFKRRQASPSFAIISRKTAAAAWQHSKVAVRRGDGYCCYESRSVRHCSQVHKHTSSS